MKPSLTESYLCILENKEDFSDRITFRPIADADRPFLFQLYASTRESELALVDWSPDQKIAFLEMQFNAQHTHYLKYFQQASFDVIEFKDSPIGRLYLNCCSTDIRIVDITLMPEFRDRGIGTAILKTILAKGRANNQPVTIHVEQNNRALNLYRRLGFERKGEDSIYYLMEWTPSSTNVN